MTERRPSTLLREAAPANPRAAGIVRVDAILPLPRQGENHLCRESALEGRQGGVGCIGTPEKGTPMQEGQLPGHSMAHCLHR